MNREGVPLRGTDFNPSPQAIPYLFPLPFSLERFDRMDIRIGDILTMKKPHPCGSRDWQVLRIGADFRLRCCGCGHEVMGARSKFEKNIRQVKRETV